MLPSFFDSMVSLIVRTSTDLPPDERAAMAVERAQETSATQSAQALAIIAHDIALADADVGAICEDTGVRTFEHTTPVGANQVDIKKDIRREDVVATMGGKLQPISVVSIVDENSGKNV